MPVWAWILIGVAIALAAAAVFAVAEAKRRRQRTEHLRERFGPEYDRVVSDLESTRAGETELEQRESRRHELDIRPLEPEARERFTDEWHAVQESFVDDPGHALRDADRLVHRVMTDRGYPMDDFEQRAADISVDHPDVVATYRSAHAVFVSQREGTATTEDLRHAMVDYRALFDELLAPDLAAVR